MTNSRTLTAAGLVGLAAITGCRWMSPTERDLAAAPAGHAAHAAAVDQWHREREERLRAEDGWLTLVGLCWLEPGDNAAGRAASDAVSHAGFPAERLGVFVVEGDAVSFRAESGAPIEGVPANGRLETDANGSPTVLTAGACTMYVLQRGDRFAVRVKDRAAPLRETFSGIDRFPVSESWRVTARLEPATEERLPVDLIIGTVTEMEVAGRARFEHAGESVALTMHPGAAPDRFFVVFGDTTNRGETYGGGRFLEAILEPDGSTVTLDFNRAYNPPCSFTPYATCPLPRPENRLPFPVEAGEKRWSGLH